jgi:hypothetical protein
MRRLLIGLTVTAVIGCCALALLGFRSAVVDSMVFGGTAVCDFLQARAPRRGRARADSRETTSPSPASRACSFRPAPALRPHCPRVARPALAPADL